MQKDGTYRNKQSDLFLDVWLFFFVSKSFSWEANKRSDGQGVPHFLWSPKVHYRFLQELAIRAYAERDKFSQHPIYEYFIGYHFNIVLPSTPRSPKYSHLL
jgi:hypothetical protein